MKNQDEMVAFLEGKGFDAYWRQLYEWVKTGKLSLKDFKAVIKRKPAHAEATDDL